jgi:hypothetical protein
MELGSSGTSAIPLSDNAKTTSWYLLQDKRGYHECKVCTITDTSATGAACGVKCL